MGLVNFKEEITPDLKYYAFDWDDNIMYMPTQIVLKDENPYHRRGREPSVGRIQSQGSRPTEHTSNKQTIAWNVRYR